MSPDTGHYGVVNVLQVSSDNYGITLASPMPAEMLSGRDFFVTRFATYSQLTVTASATVTTAAFNRTLGYGGVIAIRAGNLNLIGTIDASSLGFAGGSTSGPPDGSIPATPGGGGGGGASGCVLLPGAPQKYISFFHLYRGIFLQCNALLADCF